MIEGSIVGSENLTVFPEECLGRYKPTRFRQRRRRVQGRGGDLRRELPLEQGDFPVWFIWGIWDFYVNRNERTGTVKIGRNK